MALLNIKENFRRIYSKHSRFIKPGIKFAFVLISLLVMNHFIGFNDVVSNPVVLILFAALCAVLSTGVSVVIYTVIILMNMYNISPEITLVIFLTFVLMYFLFFRFSAEDGFVMLAMPILFFIKMPFIMPLIVGVALEPAAIIAMAFGTITFYMLQYGGDEAVLVANGMGESGIEKISSFISKLFLNKEMLVMIVAFAVAALVVYEVRRLSIDNAHTIAIIAGGTIEAIVMLGCVYIMEIEGTFKLWMIVTFTVVSIILTLIIKVFIISVDYSGTEYAQFEDDDYYYYVKAVPKIKVTKQDVKVKRINVKRQDKV